MEKTYRITGMKCQGCADTVTKKLSAVGGVKAVLVDLENSTAQVTGKPLYFSLKQALKGTSYKLE
ncbi:heavy-metal-associated domain-containing protein [Streptococcus hongkongensis]|nr:carbonate dehydratase [Streptococcus uberis]